MAAQPRLVSPSGEKASSSSSSQRSFVSHSTRRSKKKEYYDRARQLIAEVDERNCSSFETIVASQYSDNRRVERALERARAGLRSGSTERRQAESHPKKARPEKAHTPEESGSLGTVMAERSKRSVTFSSRSSSQTSFPQSHKPADIPQAPEKPNKGERLYEL